jgi:hypothetical protein
MSQDPKTPSPPPAPSPAAAASTHKGMKIFTYPKIIFIVPTLVAALLCGMGMTIIGDKTHDPSRRFQALREAVKGTDSDSTATQADAPPAKRFSSSQNLLGILFLTTFAINLLIMAIDFPRFTVILIILGAAAVAFFFLWLNVYYDLLPPLVRLLENIFAVANAQFYFLFATVIMFNFAVIWVTRYLDYWEILPNEILHNHGPFSDLERFPTTSLKFDKEIPDILEYALLRSGRLVLHVANERKAIVLDNVLWIDRKEDELKKLMSRLEVRITTDQEAAEPM